MKHEKTEKKHGAAAAMLSAAVLIGIAVGLFFAYRAYQRASYPRKYSEYVGRYAAEYDVDSVFIYAIIKTESDFRPDAVSGDDACGLMQLLPSTLEWLQTLTAEDDHYVRADLFDPEINIRYGVYFLSILFEKFAEPDTVAAAYHAGLNGVQKWLQNSEYSADGVTLQKIPYADTAQYVARIHRRCEIYRSLYKS
ncbi:MAG: lytic transglycosylase domain-containing protein [Acutalibacteraceae bacterium]|jgi:soluble lytic murein transglycosylase